ncbi:MAG: indole-3-glycerol phosphate synthase TrpC [Desulfobacteraceae bacterium]|nr:indole-3-glycerol phosphate synthase TrpC [Desulfobacteraceae bacterium]
MKKDFLSIIVEQKKDEIAAAQKRVPEKQLRAQAEIPRQTRRFMKKLEQRDRVNIIAEIKRASPSKGHICPNLDPASYASEYEQGGAAALSVLTDHAHFQGSFEDLKTARKNVTLPVLRKDFLISSYQIYESSVLEADAILLIVRILSREQLRDYLKLAGELGLDALVEVHSEKEIESATWAGAKLVGINNRNLQSFETNIETAANMVSLLEPHQVPVAESGIQTREDIEKLQDSGIWNFLIGESLVRAPNTKDFLKSLMGL